MDRLISVLKEDMTHFLKYANIKQLFLIKEGSIKTLVAVKIMQKMEKSSTGHES
jgi:hypothetical protein